MTSDPATAPVTAQALTAVFFTILLGLTLMRDGGRDGVDVRPAIRAADRGWVRRLRAQHGGGALVSVELDQWDDAGVLLLATSAGVPVGSLRYLLGSPPDMPHADRMPAFVPTLPAGSRYVDVGRLVVVPEQRYFGVTAALALSVLQDLPSLRAEGVVTVAADAALPYYRRMGYRTAARGEYKGGPYHLLAIDDLAFPMLTAIRAFVAAARSAPAWRLDPIIAPPRA